MKKKIKKMKLEHVIGLYVGLIVAWIAMCSSALMFGMTSLLTIVFNNFLIFILGTIYVQFGFAEL